jgi:hypothetical protein
MAQNKILNVEPAYVASAAANILNCAITSVAGPVGITLTQPYMIVKHIRLNNKDNIAHVVTLYKGATGGSAGGTEFAFDAISVPAASSVDWYGQARFDSTDFLTGVADLASKVTINIDAEVGFS